MKLFILITSHTGYGMLVIYLWQYMYNYYILTKEYFILGEKDASFEQAWKEALEEAKRSYEENEKTVSDFNETAWGEVLDSYDFATDNPLLNHANAFEKGMHYFNEGSLGLAVLAFESEVQRDSGNSEAWRMLGIFKCINIFIVFALIRLFDLI